VKEVDVTGTIIESGGLFYFSINGFSDGISFIV